MRFLGLDVGGTNCRYEYWPAGSGASGRGAGVQPAVHGLDATITGLTTVLREAEGRAEAPTAAVLAMAGAGDAATARAIADGLRAAGIRYPVHVVGDVLAAAAAALRDRPSVLLWSGTGSFAVARGGDGGAGGDVPELHRVGGRGYLLGDQGSGFDFVRRAAAAAILAADDLGPATSLTNELVAAFDAPSIQRLGAVLQGLDTATVAARLPIVLQAAARGDVVSNEVLAAGSESLALLATAAARTAGLDPRGTPVRLGGGVLLNVPAIRELVAARLTALDFTVGEPIAENAAAVGAAWLAAGSHAARQPESAWMERVTL